MEGSKNCDANHLATRVQSRDLFSKMVLPLVDAAVLSAGTYGSILSIFRPVGYG